MTARTCPIHGEYSATGVCRWCEPETKYSLKSVDAVTHQSFIDRTNQAISDLLALPPTCICEKCLRGFDAPIPLTSLVCPECRNAARVDEALDMLGPPPDVAKILRTYKPEFLTRIGFTWTEAVIGADMNAAEQSRLDVQHAALRWERVARRWAAKGPTPSLHRTTVDGVGAFDDHCAQCLREGRRVPP